MLDRPRLVLLGWALLSFLLFGLVLVAVIQGWGPVRQFDNRGSPAAEYAVDSGWLLAAAARRRGRLREPLAWRS